MRHEDLLIDTGPRQLHSRSEVLPASRTYNAPSHINQRPRAVQLADQQAALPDRMSLKAEDTLSPKDLAILTARQLRIMVNQAYKLMDTDYPPVGAVDQYKMIVDELEHRALQAAEHQTACQLRETFRDNPLYCRFELFVDGSLAAYVKYTMIGGQIVLLDGMEQPRFRDQGIDATLMRHIVLNAHKRRLSLLPQCAMAFSFLADNPHYQALTGQLRTGHLRTGQPGR